MATTKTAAKTVRMNRPIFDAVALEAVLNVAGWTIGKQTKHVTCVIPANGAAPTESLCMALGSIMLVQHQYPDTKIHNDSVTFANAMLGEVLSPEHDNTRSAVIEFTGFTGERSAAYTAPTTKAERESGTKNNKYGKIRNCPRNGQTLIMAVGSESDIPSGSGTGDGAAPTEAATKSASKVTALFAKLAAEK